MVADRRQRFDDVDVALSYFSKGGERFRTPHTGITAEAHGPPSLFIAVWEAGVLDNLARRLGTQDVLTGSSAFDRRFMVKSNLPEGARVWLHPRTRRRMAATSGYRFQLEDGRVSAVRPGIVDENDEQRRVMRAVASFAHGMRALESSWRKVAEALDRGRVRKRINGWLRLKGQLDGHEVNVRIRSRAARATTLVEAHRTIRHTASFSDPTLTAIGASIAVKRGKVIVTCPGICDDRERLLTCIEAAVGGTRERRGAYR